MLWSCAGILQDAVNPEAQQAELGGLEDDDMRRGCSESPGVTQSLSGRQKVWPQ